MNAQPKTHSRCSTLARAATRLGKLALWMALCVLLVSQSAMAGEPSPSLWTERPPGVEETPHLEYELQDGYLHNWLVAGPQIVSRACRGQGPAPAIVDLPAENRKFALRGDELKWQYNKAEEDHLVDLSGAYPDGSLLWSWAYAQLTSPSARPVTFALTADGPADVWLNGRHVHRQGASDQSGPRSASFRAKLAPGTNRLLLCLEQAGGPETPYTMALRVAGLETAEGVVTLPTLIEDVERRQTYERLFEQVHLVQDVSLRGNEILLRWEEDPEAEIGYLVHVLDDKGRIYVEMQSRAGPWRTENAGHPARIWEGAYRVALRPTRQLFYIERMHYQRDIPLQIVDHDYSTAPYGTYAERRQEALQVAVWQESDLYSKVARMALGRWDKVDVEMLLDLVEGDLFARDLFAHDPASLTVLLGALYRYTGRAGLDASLTQRLDEAIARADYWQAPARDAPIPAGESQRILYYANQVLAGQRHPAQVLAGPAGALAFPARLSGGPARVFAGSRYTGRWHRARGERMLFPWLRAPMAEAVDLWDLQRTLPDYVVALSHLAEWAENDELRTLAKRRLDEMLTWLAQHSYQGVYGTSHRRAYGSRVKSGRLATTAGISRLLWGTGAYNRHIAAVVSLAVSGYRSPPEEAQIARGLPLETWHQEPYDPPTERGLSQSRAGSAANLNFFRTPDYMLSSASDYRPGQRGDGEHVWQATLGPDALVYVNHPANMSQKDAHRNGFWHGNATLPRVAQWKDTLIAVHNLPEEDWMGFTHAYWPAYAFDETAILGSPSGQRWAFARNGDGYIALTAARGIEPVTRGPGAYRELRSYGRQNVWLCLMGRAAADGSFEAFQRAVLDADVEFGDLSVRLETLRGETLTFGWSEPLARGGFSF